MKNTKLEKLELDISRTETRIAELQLKLGELEKQKTELENLDIINFVRSEKVSDADLHAYISSLRRKNKAASNTVSAAPQLNRQETEESKNARNT